jgi:hypothetical protein
MMVRINKETLSTQLQLIILISGIIQCRIMVEVVMEVIIIIWVIIIT